MLFTKDNHWFAMRIMRLYVNDLLDIAEGGGGVKIEMLTVI